MLSIRSGVDGLQTKCGWCVHLGMACRWHVHNMSWCWWHVHMQMRCEQCLDVICRENHQHKLSRKSFTWSWNKIIQNSCHKFHSHSKIVQVHAKHQDQCRWLADKVWMTCPVGDVLQMNYGQYILVWMTCTHADEMCADDMYTCRWDVCGWHVHMQMRCEQCLDVICRENHQHKLSRKSFTWSWNKIIQNSCHKFHSITNSCHIQR